MSEKRINPLLTIWVTPRKTIRQIIEDNPRKNFFLLIFITMIMGLVAENGINKFITLPVIIIFILPFIAYLIGLVVVYIEAELLE